MKLYAFQPQGHGEQSFFVMAESETAARSAVNQYVRTPRLISPDNDPDNPDDYSRPDADGWGTDYYRMTIADVGEVIENDND